MAVSRSRTSGIKGLLAGRGRRSQRLAGDGPETISHEAIAAASQAARVAARMADQMLVAAGAETASHSRAVEGIALRMADRLGLSGRDREAVGVTARLHDIGKVAMPRTLLEKTGPLTSKEWDLVYAHTLVGERVLQAVHELRPLAGMVRHSHERWDGTGYPDGLEGEQIPQASRIVFCADAFHAICSDRPYRRGVSAAAALAEVRRCAGTQFEPRVVEALTAVVRNRLYGRRYVRRRSHASLSVLMLCALILGGSIAGGIAASRDASDVPGQESLAAGLPPTASGLQLGPELIRPSSPVAVFAQARLLNEANGPAPGQAGADPEPTAPAPAEPERTPRQSDRSRGIAPPSVAPSVPHPSEHLVPGIGDRLGISPATDGGDGSGEGFGSDEKGPDSGQPLGNDRALGLPLG